MGGKLNLDKLDLQIIHEMMETAEISYADLGKKLFVTGGGNFGNVHSEPEVWSRGRRLRAVDSWCACKIYDIFTTSAIIAL